MKKYLLLVISVLFFSGISNAQSQTDVAIKYAKTITQGELKKQLMIVASAEMEGRETGTEGQRKAAAYIESQFKKFGLQSPEVLDGYRQYYPLYKDSLVPKYLKIGKNKLEYGTDYILQTASSADNQFKARGVVFAGYGIQSENYDDYAGKDVKGKVVVIISGEPKENGNYLVSGNDERSRWGYSTSMKAAVAKEKGAAALILINTRWDSISTRLVKATKSSNLYFPRPGNDGLTVITMVMPQLQHIFGEADTQNVIEKIKAGKALNNIVLNKKMKVKLAFKKIRTKVMASNVIGFVEGSDKKDEYVFVTAHYDHLGRRGEVIYYGADDDGSGTVSIIEMAEAFAKAKEDGHGPRRTIVFMAVSGEEKGLWGSEYYSEHPIFPLEKTTVDLNIDMIGRIDPGRKHGDSTNYVYVVGDDKLSSDLKPISIAANDKLTHLELDYKFNDPNDPLRIYYRSDHYNFARKGVPIIFYFDGIHKDYHKPTDTFDKINYSLMEKRARLVFMTAWDMANREDMLVRDIPLPSGVR